MATVEFKPNDTAPSDAERTVYNVFVDGKFTGYISPCEWMGVWAYYVEGKHAGGFSYADRCDLFALIKENPMWGRA